MTRAEGLETATLDHAILRQISALVSTLPTMDAKEFQDEFTMVGLMKEVPR